MIENYNEKKANKNIELEFTESGNIVVLERKFNTQSGLRELVVDAENPQGTNSQHLADLILEDEKAVDAAKVQLEAAKDRLADRKALAADVKAMEEKRAQAEEKAGKKGK